MEVTESLLVAMMFVMILSIGIGNILMGLSGVLQSRSEIDTHWIPLSWVLIVLLTHLELFWQTLEIVSVESWRFAAFLFVISGPVALLLATTLMLPDSARAEDGDYRAHYFTVAPRFFGLLAALMFWMVGVDLVFLGEVGAPGVWNLLEGLVFAALATVRAVRFHEIGTVAAWVMVLSDATFQGFLG